MLSLDECFAVRRAMAKGIWGTEQATCLAALKSGDHGTVALPINDSEGCGAITGSLLGTLYQARCCRGGRCVPENAMSPAGAGLIKGPRQWRGEGGSQCLGECC